ncbi:MAG: hypothetical protein V1664_01100 [Candidatus Uhrbacteria bacterium]
MKQKIRPHQPRVMASCTTRPSITAFLKKRKPTIGAQTLKHPALRLSPDGFRYFEENEKKMKNATVSVPARVAAALTSRQLARAQAILENEDNYRVIFAPDCDIPEGSRAFRTSAEVYTKKFPFNVGFCRCVVTFEGDDVFYAEVQRRGDSPIWGKFVRGVKPQMSRTQTVIAHPHEDGWKVVAAYCGDSTPQFPGDPTGSFAQAMDFWADHALIEGTIQG